MSTVAPPAGGANDDSCIAYQEQGAPTLHEQPHQQRRAALKWKHLAQKSVDHGLLDEETLQTANMYLKDGIHGRLIGYSLQPKERNSYKRFHSTIWRSLYVLAATCHIMFAQWERSANAEESGASASTLDIVLGLAEVVFLFIYTHDIVLFFRCYGWANIFAHRWTLGRLVIITCIAIDLALAFSSSFTLFRFSRVLRPFLLILRLRNIRRVFGGMVVAFPKVFVVLMICFVFITIYALTGFLFFWDTPNSTHFQTLPSSIYTMLLLQTSPPKLFEILYPHFVRSEWSALFFVSFMIFGNMFLLKLLIVVSYQSFKAFTEKLDDRSVHKRHLALTACFRLLSSHQGGHGVTPHLWHQLLCKFRGLDVPMQTSDILFQSVAPSNEAKHTGLGLQEFIQLCALARFSIDEPPLSFPCHRIETARRHVRHAWQHTFSGLGATFYTGEACMNVVMLASLVQVYMLSHPHPNENWAAMGVVLLVFFLIEMALKIFAFGFMRYIKSHMHKVDLLCNAYGVVFYCWVGVHHYVHKNYPHLYILILMSRLLRMFKLFYLCDLTRSVLSAITAVFHVVVHLAFVFFAILYVYAILAMESFTADFSSVYAEQINFTSFLRSLLTLFQVSIVGSWTMIMDSAAQHHNYVATRFFFFSFRLIVSLVFIPMFVGIVIETFAVRFHVVKFTARKELEERGAEDGTLATPLIGQSYGSLTSSVSAGSPDVELDSRGNKKKHFRKNSFDALDEIRSTPVSDAYQFTRRIPSTSSNRYDVSAVNLQKQHDELLQAHQTALMEIEWKDKRILAMAQTVNNLNARLSMLQKELSTTSLNKLRK